MAVKMSPQATRKFYSQQGRTKHKNIQLLKRFQKQEEQRDEDKCTYSYDYYEKRARKKLKRARKHGWIYSGTIYRYH